MFTIIEPHSSQTIWKFMEKIGDHEKKLA